MIKNYVPMRISKIFLFVSIISISNLQAQVKGGYNEKLEKLYISGKYESCLFKADNLTYKESSSRDPEPYLYIAMCFYQLSKSADPIIAEDYADGEKQAISYTAKFIKKDKDGEMYENNLEFINMLKELQYKKVKQVFDEENYRKAATETKKYEKLNREEDFTITYFLGACELMSNNYSQGQKNLDHAKEQLITLIKAGNVKVDKIFKPLISSVFLKYSEFLVADSKLEDAAKELKLGLKIIPNDGFLKIQSNMVNKKLEADSH